MHAPLLTYTFSLAESVMCYEGCTSASPTPVACRETRSVAYIVRADLNCPDDRHGHSPCLAQVDRLGTPRCNLLQVVDSSSFVPSSSVE
jgi:hypothetical protein